MLAFHEWVVILITIQIVNVSFVRDHGAFLKTRAWDWDPAYAS